MYLHLKVITNICMCFFKKKHLISLKHYTNTGLFIMISKSEKIEIIKKIVDEGNVSKYQISKITTVSEPTIGRILSGATKKPSDRIVDEIYNSLTNESNTNNLFPKDTEVYFEKDGLRVSVNELSTFIASNEDAFMKEKIFSNIIEIRVAKRIAEITTSKEKLIEYLKE